MSDFQSACVSSVCPSGSDSFVNFACISGFHTQKEYNSSDWKQLCECFSHTNSLPSCSSSKKDAAAAIAVAEVTEVEPHIQIVDDEKTSLRARSSPSRCIALPARAHQYFDRDEDHDKYDARDEWDDDYENHSLAAMDKATEDYENCHY